MRQSTTRPCFPAAGIGSGMAGVRKAGIMGKIVWKPPAGPDHPIYSEGWSIQSHRKPKPSTEATLKSSDGETEAEAPPENAPAPSRPRKHRKGAPKRP